MSVYKIKLYDPKYSKNKLKKKIYYSKSSDFFKKEFFQPCLSNLYLVKVYYSTYGYKEFYFHPNIFNNYLESEILYGKFDKNIIKTAFYIPKKKNKFLRKIDFFTTDNKIKYFNPKIENNFHYTETTRNNNIINIKKSVSSDITLCIICYKKTKNIVYHNCNHLVCCEDCANKVDICPICRKEIVKTQKIYY